MVLSWGGSVWVHLFLISHIHSFLAYLKKIYTVQLTLVTKVHVKYQMNILNQVYTDPNILMGDADEWVNLLHSYPKDMLFLTILYNLYMYSQLFLH